MKINFFILLSILSIVILSCDDGVKFDNPNDQNADITDSSDSQNDEDKDSTDTVADEDPNEQADTENDENSDPNDTTPDDADSTDDNSDSGDDEDTDTSDSTDDLDSAPDNGDNDTETNDDTDTENDADKDENISDPTDDTDSDNPDTSDSDNDNDADTTDSGSPYSDLDYETTESNCPPKPANSVWNDNGRNGKFTQIWDGENWLPETYESTYSITAGTCRYKCDTDYNWTNNACKKAETRNASCQALPENAVWNTVDTITQTWNGIIWEPSTTPLYNLEESTNECRFKCNTNYSWKNGSCVSGKHLSIGNICTGQTTCYNNSSSIICPSSGSFFGQDAYYASLGIYCTPQNLTLKTISDKTVVEDLNTGLMWQQTPSSTAYNWEYAKTYCNGLKYAGYEDWRLPSPIEFLTISEISEANSTFDPDYFPNISESDTPNFWTSKENKDAVTEAYFWSSRTNNSEFATVEKTTANNVMCVRGNEIPEASFTAKNINGYDVVTDSTTGLMWQNEFSSKTWSTALSYCESSTYAGYNDWRLPNRNELESLLNYEKSEAPYSDFPNISSSYFWSSTTSSDILNYAWSLNFQSGNLHSISKSNSYYTICVRSNTDFPEAQRTVNCVLKPELTTWNTASTITQTWNGEDWVPSPIGTLNSEPSTSECRYRCIDGYHWEEWTEYTSFFDYITRKECVSNTKTVSCTGLKTGGEWNAVSSITQTWNGEDWVPSKTASYNETPSLEECRYKCKEHYTWNEETCEADKQTVECEEKPEHTVWNSVSEITQTWNGSSWTPSTISSYNETASETECRFKCEENYFFDPNSGKCLNPCDPNPCNAVAHSTHQCTASAWYQYSCECEENYYWGGENAGCTTQRPGFGKICTGQTSCYNASSSMTCPTSSSTDFFGQDAQYAAQGVCTTQSFTVQTISSEEVVLSNNTGLMWQQTPPSTTYTWANAKNYCSNLEYAGYSDWRLPTSQELLTIVDNSKYGPAINMTYFPGTPSNYFWSSSTYIDYTSSAWHVHFYLGVTGYSLKTSNYPVRCVRGATLPTGSFESSTVQGDVIVTDTETGLIWQKTYETGKTWQEALSYCENLTYAGYDDWRLPNKNELASLVNYAKYNPASDFPDMSSNYFWSSSTRVDYTGLARSVDFSNGREDTNGKSSNYDVRCVRN